MNKVVRMRVVKNSADSEKDSYKVVLKGDGDFQMSTLVEVELTLKAKEDAILDKFIMDGSYTLILEDKAE